MDSNIDPSISPTVLQEYVRGYLQRFVESCAGRFHQMGTSLTPYTAIATMQEFLNNLPALNQQPEPVRELQLDFRHDCLSLGCLDQQCVLCQHNPARRCTQNLSTKYLVGDIIKAKCSSPLRLELVDNSGRCCDDALADAIKFEMFIIDGGMYDEGNVDLDACAKLVNKKGEPLLVGGAADAQGKLIISPTRGVIHLPDAHMTDSSEALLGSGRKPYFRLVVKPVAGQSMPVNLSAAVSESFTVATRRTRTAAKVDVPSQDDHVSKLIHMGKETVKKLRNIKEAAVNVAVDLDIPENNIQTVRDFQQLVSRADQDGLLRQKLQRVLMLSKEKWEEAREHAMKAVKADNRLRLWYSDPKTMETGLMFKCRKGVVDLGAPVALVQKKLVSGQLQPEFIRVHHLNPAQLEIRRQLQPQAGSTWWLSGHPGWAISPWDSDVYEQTGILATVGNWKEGEEHPSSYAPSAAGYPDSPTEVGPPSPGTTLPWPAANQSEIAHPHLAQSMGPPVQQVSTYQHGTEVPSQQQHSSQAPSQQQPQSVMLPSPMLPPNLHNSTINQPVFQGMSMPQYGSSNTYNNSTGVTLAPPPMTTQPMVANNNMPHSQGHALLGLGSPTSQAGGPPQSMLGAPFSAVGDSRNAGEASHLLPGYGQQQQQASQQLQRQQQAQQQVQQQARQQQQQQAQMMQLQQHQLHQQHRQQPPTDFRSVNLAAAVLDNSSMLGAPPNLAPPNLHPATTAPSQLAPTRSSSASKYPFLSMSMVEAATQALQEAGQEEDELPSDLDAPHIMNSKELETDTTLNFLQLLKDNTQSGIGLISNQSWDLLGQINGLGGSGGRVTGPTTIPGLPPNSGLNDMTSLEAALQLEGALFNNQGEDDGFALPSNLGESMGGQPTAGSMLAKRTREMRSVTSLDFR